ncbi:hypothetical protein K438DRAFT_1787361 [Mycena galopus ATCC 62051]|nr:hypothetical protein K438DRAFT_1787361 [Mycena galopus ATCC 62051]
MDEYYPREDAATAIEIWNAKLGSSDAPFTQLGLTFPASVVNVMLQPANITIATLEGGMGAKAMFPNNSEAVFTLVGVLTEKQLPPVKRSDINPSELQYARQHASIAGLSSAHFTQAISNLEEISFEMHRAFAEGHHVPASAKTTFDERTDPHGILGAYLSDKVSHCFDNDVAYLALVDEIYVNKAPASFRIGDIVEMGFAFSAWRLPKNNVGPKYTSRLVLRTLTYLDGSFTKAAYLKRTRTRPSGGLGSTPDRVLDPTNQVAKRRLKDAVANVVDDVPEIRAKMSNLMIKETVVAPSTRDAAK